jgi:hypothetical protein
MMQSNIEPSKIWEKADILYLLHRFFVEFNS